MADADSRTGSRYTTPEILDYVASLHAPNDAALTSAFEAPRTFGIPAIQVGPLEGATLHMLVRLIGAQKIVEVGTLAGYSTIWLARGMATDGHLWTIEYEPRHAQIARENITLAGLDERVEVRVGRALDVLPGLENEGPFDAVFIDADKESYVAYGRWAAKHLRRGGLLIADNVFLFGDLLAPTPRAATMRQFHEEARQQFDATCISTPDGLLVGIKK